MTNGNELAALTQQIVALRKDISGIAKTTNEHMKSVSDKLQRIANIGEQHLTNFIGDDAKGSPEDPEMVTCCSFGRLFKRFADLIV